MGYALFAQRKIMLTDRVNNLQLDLTEISNKKNKLQQIGSAVADGDISALDLAQCQEVGLALAYKMDMDGKLALSKTSAEYQTGRGMAEKEADKTYGGSRILNGVCGAGAGAAAGAAIGSFFPVVGTAVGAIAGGLIGAFISDKASSKSQAKNEQIDEYTKAYEEAQLANIVEDLQKDIAEMENKLDKQQANLETKLTATQSELESVKEAEGRAIQNSTPKYAGLA